MARRHAHDFENAGDVMELCKEGGSTRAVTGDGNTEEPDGEAKIFDVEAIDLRMPS